MQWSFLRMYWFQLNNTIISLKSVIVFLNNAMVFLNNAVISLNNAIVSPNNEMVSVNIMGFPNILVPHNNVMGFQMQWFLSIMQNIAMVLPNPVMNYPNNLLF